MTTETPLPWPETGDTLFSGDEADWKNNACLNFGMGDHGYMEGFKLGADSLVAQIEATPVDQDFLVYPVVFSYRQYLELRLKDLRVQGFRLFGWALPQKLSHRLPEIWDDCLKVIQNAFPSEDPAAAAAVETIIDEFDAMDPDSFAFRYSTSKGGAPTLPAHLTRINLRHLRDTMQKVAMFLDAAAEGISDMLDAQSASAGSP